MLMRLPSLFLFLLFAACSSPRDKALDQLKAEEQKLFSDSARAFDRMAATALMKQYMDFASTYPADSVSAGILFKAGELANGLGQSSEAIGIFRKIEQDYPTYSKVPVCIFLEGFICETQLHDMDGANYHYTRFLKQYPSHHLAKDVTFSLRNLGKSPEELIRQFEQKGTISPSSGTK